jgi:DNA-directed RNA polymerase alpha subunit
MLVRDSARRQGGAPMNAPTVEFEQLAALALPTRVENCLRADGVWFIYELCERNESDLLKLPGVGTTSIRCIRDALAKRGLVLAQ